MAKPSLALIPSAVGDGALYSVLPSTGVGDFDFSRSGTATRVNAQGLIETVDANTPRLNYPLINGKVSGCPSLLLEPSRTNLVANSNDFTSWINSGSYITANYGISPDGSQNASRCLFTGSGQTLSKNIGTDGTFSYSIYVKGVEGETIQISMASASDESFTLNGQWQRLSYSNTVTNSTININTHNNSTARDLLIFGAQLEQGSYPTSYIPTNGQPITRSAETCNGAGGADTFNDSEGVLYVEISALDDDETFRILALSNNNADNHVRIYYTNNSNTISILVRSGGVNQYTFLNYNVNDITEYIKIAVKYKDSDFATFLNGVKINSKTDGGISPVGLDRLNFDNGIGGSDFYGNVKDLRVYNTALTDTELEELTTI